MICRQARRQREGTLTEHQTGQHRPRATPRCSIPWSSRAIFEPAASRLCPRFRGSDEVDGSSPSEGFAVQPAICVLSLSGLAASWFFGVHRASTERPRWTFAGAERVEQPDCVLAAVASEVAVTAIDHRQTGAQRHPRAIGRSRLRFHNRDATGSRLHRMPRPFVCANAGETTSYGQRPTRPQ